LGLGSKAKINPIGKSQFLNDLIHPQNDSKDEIFETQDRNLFSNGQVDIYFGK